MYIHDFSLKLFRSLAVKSDLCCGVFLFGTRTGQEEKKCEQGKQTVSTWEVNKDILLVNPLVY